MAKPKRIRIRTGLRTASKVQEKQLLSAGKWLAENPAALIPKCENECRKCDFDKIEQRLLRISQAKDDERLLKKMSKRGPQIVRAYAATLLQSKLERAPYLAVAKGPDGDIAYMHSSRVKKEVLIGVQYFKDPRMRLLSFSDISARRKLAFYSVGNGVYCSREDGKPPIAFIKESISKLSLTKRDNSTYTCQHDPNKYGYLQIFWKNADLSIMICEECLSDRNSIRTITQRMITPSLETKFTLSASVRLECEMQCDSCPGNDSFKYDEDDVKKYLSGKISDKELYKIAADKFLSSLKSKDYEFASIGINCYGKDKELLAKAIATNDTELEAIKILLSKLDFPIILPEEITTNKLLSQYWKEYGNDVLFEMTGQKFDEAPELTGEITPMGIIEKVKKKKKSDALRESLPEYSSMGFVSAFSDKIAREAKLHGKESALKIAAPSGHEQTKMKSVGLAFRIALGETGMNWQYTKEEIDFANHLAPFAKELIESTGDTYDEALRELITNAGIEEKIIKIR